MKYSHHREQYALYQMVGVYRRINNKHLTENSGLLSHLIPGDTILADRGFDIADSVGIYCA